MFNKKIFWINFSCFLIFILDQVFKKIALVKVKKSFLFFDFTLALNKNISLGIPFPPKLFYLLILIIIFWLIANILKSYQKKLLVNIWGLELILIGAFSNLLDRLIHGSVIDYLLIPGLTIFNLADLSIIAGVVILFWKILISKQSFFQKK